MKERTKTTVIYSAGLQALLAEGTMDGTLTGKIEGLPMTNPYNLTSRLMPGIYC